MARKKKRRHAFGVLIAAARERLDLDQHVVATACGVHLSAVSHWERGVSKPSDAHLRPLADVLGLRVDEIASALGIKIVMIGDVLYTEAVVS